MSVFWATGAREQLKRMKKENEDNSNIAPSDRKTII
jgi:hypothetical protein